jgi:hypothetical protein
MMLPNTYSDSLINPQFPQRISECRSPLRKNSSRVLTTFPVSFCSHIDASIAREAGTVAAAENSGIACGSGVIVFPPSEV